MNARLALPAKRHRRDIFVENPIEKDFPASSGVTSSEYVAPDGALSFCGRRSTTMPRLRRYMRIADLRSMTLT